MASKVLFNGYIDMGVDGIIPIEIQRDGEYTDVFINNDVADDVDSREYLESNYGDTLYRSLDDFRSGNKVMVSEVWEDGR